MQTKIPCVLMRGGTSKGPFFLASDLPEDADLRDRVLLKLMGSPDMRQIDGIGAAELRLKESDRIGALAENLRRLGASVQEYPDGLEVAGRQKLHGAVVDSFGDPRIAMAKFHGRGTS